MYLYADLGHYERERKKRKYYLADDREYVKKNLSANRKKK